MPHFVAIASRLRHTANRWYSNESGATAVEYSMMLALISLAILTSLRGMGTSIVDLAQKLVTTLSAMMS